MDEKLLRELCNDYSQNLREHLREAQQTLKSVSKASRFIVKEIDTQGNYASITPQLKKIAILLKKVMYISGKIEAVRDDAATMETVLNCADSAAPKKRVRRRRIA